MKKFTVRVRVWVNEAEGPFLGLGRVRLLEKIHETGSITNAARAMKMSYRQAWQLVEDMNSRAKQPLVEKILGGKNGSGSVLTKAGERAIAEFYRIQSELQNQADELSKKLTL